MIRSIYRRRKSQHDCFMTCFSIHGMFTKGSISPQNYIKIQSYFWVLKLTKIDWTNNKASFALRRFASAEVIIPHDEFLTTFAELCSQDDRKFCSAALHIFRSFFTVNKRCLIANYCAGLLDERFITLCRKDCSINATAISLSAPTVSLVLWGPLRSLWLVCHCCCIDKESSTIVLRQFTNLIRPSSVLFALCVSELFINEEDYFCVSLVGLFDVVLSHSVLHNRFSLSVANRFPPTRVRSS